MSSFEILHDARSSLLHSKRVWLIQFIANPLLFALFVGWLLLPVATEFHLLLNGLVIVVVAAAALVLHAGTLNFYSEQRRDENAAARDCFRSRRAKYFRGGRVRRADLCALGAARFHRNRYSSRCRFTSARCCRNSFAGISSHRGFKSRWKELCSRSAGC